MARVLVLAAAGSGLRLGGDEPKALVRLSGRPLLEWALEALAPAGFAGVAVTAPPDRMEEFRSVVGERARVVAGGQTRTESVRRGLAALDANDDDLVCVHDAARPFVTAGEAGAVMDAAQRAGAAIGAVRVVDTIKRVSADRVVATVDRDGLYGAATPQAFRAALLRRALATGRDATDEAALCEAIGIPVAVVPLSRLSFKITTREDLEIARAVIAWRAGEGGR